MLIWAMEIEIRSAENASQRCEMSKFNGEFLIARVIREDGLAQGDLISDQKIRSFERKYV